MLRHGRGWGGAARRALGGLALVGGLAVGVSGAFAQNAPPPAGEIVEPIKLPFDDSLAGRLRVPAGFWIDVWARDLGNVRMLAAAPDGTLYATRREQGDVLALRDTDNDARADEIRVVASGLKLVHGLALHQGRLYLATDTKVLRAPVLGDGSLGALETLIDDLPDAGQHPNRTLAIGPDGNLYITVGSTCNACDEPNPDSGTIQVATADGKHRHAFAGGLRNTIGFGWHPATGELWGFDHGSDWRGNDQPPEELNLLQADRNYGWPWCFGDRQVDPYIPNQPKGSTKQAFCAASAPPALTYTAHSAPIAMVFYGHDQFPAEYRGDAFVAMRGSWNRNPPTGYKVARVRYQNGWPVGVEDFLTGFLFDTPQGPAQFGRVAGLAVAPYGSLFLSDDSNGVIYRISWAGK